MEQVSLDGDRVLCANHSSTHSFAVVVAALLSLGSTLQETAASVSSTGEEYRGEIVAEVPLLVTAGHEFEFDLTLHAEAAKPRERVDVLFQSNRWVEFTPRRVQMLPGQTTTIRARVSQSGSGLVPIVASAPGWKPLNAVVCTGFRGTFSLPVHGPLSAGTVHTLALALRDSGGHPAEVNVPVEVEIEVGRASMRAGEKWTSRLVLPIPRGGSATRNFDLLAKGWQADTVILTARVKPDPSSEVWYQTIRLPLQPAWWVLALAGATGGILCALIRLLARPLYPEDAKRLKRGLANALVLLLLSLLLGVLAYLASASGFLGIKADVSDWRSLLWLGFAFAYIGVDGVGRLVGKTLPGLAKSRTS